ncbi:GNAT family N-acetyltransferase [Niallia sp. 03133]|uniref:GNAT family N-acetyltransferase n=1 Tax=Niallia sp. 03133 TaxID=3458060 RepID=UPI004043B289
MGMRKAKITDWQELSELLHQLGYPDTDLFIKSKMEKMLNHPDEELLVYEQNGKVAALISLHFIPQLALKGDFARISYFVVDKIWRNQNIGKKVEEYIIDLAKSRNCDRIEVHCHSRRERAHRFYESQGYKESPKYFMKKMDEDGSLQS